MNPNDLFPAPGQPIKMIEALSNISYHYLKSQLYQMNYPRRFGVLESTENDGAKIDLLISRVYSLPTVAKQPSS